MLGLIWAQAANGVIGAGGVMPWHLPEDLAHFREVTLGAAVVMGRRTWESLPERFRPLPGRRNIVLTRRPGWEAAGAETAGSLAQALALVEPGAEVWVIGGGEVFAEALPLADRIERTDLDLAVDGDVVAPVPGEGWEVVREDPPEGWRTSRNGLRFRYVGMAPSATTPSPV